MPPGYARFVDNTATLRTTGNVASLAVHNFTVHIDYAHGLMSRNPQAWAINYKLYYGYAFGSNASWLAGNFIGGTGSAFNLQSAGMLTWAPWLVTSATFVLSAGATRFYINGQLHSAKTTPETAYASAGVYCGVGPSLYQWYSEERFVRALFYSRVLSVDEIRSLHTNSATGLPSISRDGLQIAWDMKPVGGIVPDLSGNGNHGVITGPYQYVPGDAQDVSWWW